MCLACDKESKSTSAKSELKQEESKRESFKAKTKTQNTRAISKSLTILIAVHQTSATTLMEAKDGLKPTTTKSVRLNCLVQLNPSNKHKFSHRLYIVSVQCRFQYKEDDHIL
jgi:hypothetical protein